MVIVVSSTDVCEDDARTDAGFRVGDDCNCAAGYAAHGGSRFSSPIPEFGYCPLQVVEVYASVEADSIVVPTGAPEERGADAVRFLRDCAFAVPKALMRESPVSRCKA